MPTACEELFLKRRHPSKRLVVGAATDGSAISTAALEVACALHNAKRGDRLVVLHASDSRKASYLPKNLQPRALQATSLDKAYACSRVQGEWASREKGGSSTSSALLALAQEQQVDLLVLGSYGRKGARSHDLGTVSDACLREGRSSIAIVRAPPAAAPKGAAPAGCRYMFATDCSRTAAMAFCMLCHQIIRPGDSILLVRCCYDNVAEPECFTTYLAMADRLHIPCETLLWRLERHHSVADGLLQLVQQKEVDALVCATPGSSQKKLGSVTEQVTRHAACNVIVIKDNYESSTAARACGPADA